jgi:hypothetical protein
MTCFPSVPSAPPPPARVLAEVRARLQGAGQPAALRALGAGRGVPCRDIARSADLALDDLIVVDGVVLTHAEVRASVSEGIYDGLRRGLAHGR